MGGAHSSALWGFSQVFKPLMASALGGQAALSGSPLLEAGPWGCWVWPNIHGGCWPQACSPGRLTATGSVLPSSQGEQLQSSCKSSGLPAPRRRKSLPGTGPCRTVPPSSPRPARGQRQMCLPGDRTGKQLLGGAVASNQLQAVPTPSSQQLPNASPQVAQAQGQPASSSQRTPGACPRTGHLLFLLELSGEPLPMREDSTEQSI